MWIICPEMFVFPILWFITQARAAPSLTAEQMDMGVVRIVKLFPHIIYHALAYLLLPHWQ